MLRVHVKDKSCNRSSRLRCSMKKGVLGRPTTLLKNRLWHRCFPVNFAKFLRTPFWQNTSERLLRLQQSWRPTTLFNRDFNTCIFLWIFQNFLNSFFYRKLRWLLLNYVIVSERMFNKKNLRRDLINLFNVQIQVSTNRSTTMRASVFLAKSAGFFYYKIFEPSRWRPKHWSGKS